MKLTTNKLHSLIQEAIDQGNKKSASSIIDFMTGKYFENIDDFWERAGILKDIDSNFANYHLIIDKKVAAWARYEIIREFSKNECAPELENSKKGTAVMSNIVRAEEFRGSGFGKLISLMSLCDLTKMGYSVTSDRNTSVNAGRAILSLLKFFPVTKSEPFDYIGWLKSNLEETYTKLEKDIKDGKVKLSFDDPGVQKLRKLKDHLIPLTPEKDDDCEPSINLFITENTTLRFFIRDPFYHENFDGIVEKLLSMSSEDIQKKMDSDPNVIGYRFNLQNTSFIDPMVYTIKELNLYLDYEDSETIRVDSKKIFTDQYIAAEIPKTTMFSDDELVVKTINPKPVSPRTDDVFDKRLSKKLKENNFKLTTKMLYKLIKEAMVPDPDPTYAALYNPNQPMALLHMDDKEAQTFILYHLTKSKQHPLYVIAYLNMEMMEEKPCIPYTYQVLGVYTEAAAQRKGFSKTLYNFAFYVADRYNYGLTSDHIVGTTKKAEMAAWKKYENSSEYKKRTTAQGNSQFDYDGKLTPNDPDDDCETTFGDKFPATDFSFQKENHGDIGQLFFTLKNNHEQFVDINKLNANVVGSHLYKIASRRFDYYYNKEITK